jgi:hypothetical protein
VIRVDYARWGQTLEDLRHLGLSAPHARTRERALALFDITQHRCATQVALRTGRRAHTVMSWVHADNAQGPDALTFRRAGGRRPLFARAAKPNWARRSAPPSARPRRAHRWGRSRATLDAAPPGRLGPRALRAGVRSRDDPNSPAPQLGQIPGLSGLRG